MTEDESRKYFLEAVDAWVCDGYFLDLRYVAGGERESRVIWDASISLHPLPPKLDHSFRIEIQGCVVGQLQIGPLTRQALNALLSEAIDGVVKTPEESMWLCMPRNNPSYYSELAQRGRWFSDLHLQVSGEVTSALTPNELSRIDCALRRSSPPFDGLTDACAWLDLKVGESNRCATISVRVGPPADLELEQCKLVDEHLLLEVIAHRSFDSKHLGLSIRSFPNVGLTTRKQIADQIVWKEPEEFLRRGALRLRLDGAANVLVMLSIGQSTVRRHWLLDKEKARNSRLLAVQHFDRDLKMIRNGVLESTDSAKFESGVAALIFLLGFTPVVQLETDSPDLIVTTPAGSLAIVECTTRVADCQTKLGKLVDRRLSLAKALAVEVAAILICRMPRDQIAIDGDELKRRNVLLLTQEDLSAAFDRVRFPTDPDKLLADALADMQEKRLL